MNRFWGWFPDDDRLLWNKRRGIFQSDGGPTVVGANQLVPKWQGHHHGSGVVSIGETPGQPGGPTFGGGSWVSVYDQYRGVGISHARPLTTTEKGVGIALTTVVAGPLAIYWGGSRVALAAWKLRPLTIPPLLSPGGGGPGYTPTSTDILLDPEGWSTPLLRGYRPSHGY